MRVFHRSFVLLIVFFLFCSVSCVSSGVETKVETTGPTPQQVLTYKGPKARIAVASFKCKAAKCSWAIGEGLADMLATALFRTGRFIVLERGEGLRAIQEELALGQSGYVRQGAAPQIGQMEGADILVIGAITAFEPEASGIGGGGVVVPFKVPLFGGVKVGKKEAYIAADIRLVDVRTGRVINATHVEGKASSWKVGGLMGGVFGDIGLGGGLGVYKNTPMEKAVRVMLNNAVQAIAQMVPENYYRWGEGAEGPQSVSTAAPVRPASQAGSVSGGLVRPSARFRPGNKVVWQEDFSSCEEVPTSVKILRGSAECDLFQGKKWLATVKGTLIFEKRLPNNFSFTKDWALEYTFYSTDYFWHVDVALGSLESSLKLEMDPHNAKWGGKPVPIETSLAKAIHQVALQKKGDMLRIFLDGRRIFSDKIDQLVLRRIPRVLVFRVGSEVSNIDIGKYTLITDIRLTSY